VENRVCKEHLYHFDAICVVLKSYSLSKKIEAECYGMSVLPILIFQQFIFDLCITSVKVRIAANSLFTFEVLQKR
jgi:hypothetical protein